MNFGVTPGEQTTRRDLDVAVGILVGLRGCSPREAFDELVGVAHRTGLGIFTVAASLGAVAGGTSTARDSEAFNAWGDLIGQARRIVTGARIS